MRTLLSLLPLLVLGCASRALDLGPPVPPRVVSVERATREGRTLGFVTGFVTETREGAPVKGWWVKDPELRVLGFVTPEGSAHRALPDGRFRPIGRWTRERAVAEVYGFPGGVRLEAEP